MEYLLEICDIEAGYDKRPVLHGISLEMTPGEIVALVGPNGAGKSTLLKAIFGLVKATQGTITFRGQKIQNRKPSDNVKDGMSYVLQGSRVFNELSVRENLEVGGYTLPSKDVNARIEEVLSFFPDLRSLHARNARCLSGGERQMLALARALMLKPVLLLADEPSLGLGPVMAHATLSHLHDLSRQSGTTILLVEQNVREALAVAQRVCVLRLGRVVLTDTPQTLTLERLQQAFLG